MTDLDFPAATRDSTRREVLVHVACATRGQSRLDEPCHGGCSAPAADAVIAIAKRAATGLPWVLTGGEPTLRPDLPDLIAAGRADGAAAITLRTDGAVLTSSSVLRQLVVAGMSTPRIRLHSGQAAAHDWLEGRAGAARQAMRAIRTCAQAGLPVEVECVVTRPTAHHLADTAELAVRLGARRVFIRRLRALGPAAREFTALSPRLGLIGRWLEAAVAVCECRAVEAILVDFPSCTVPHIADRGLQSTAMQWLSATHPVPPTPTSDDVCAECPARPTCAGASDYTAHFGRHELVAMSMNPLSNATQLGGRESDLSGTPVGSTRKAPPTEPTARVRRFRFRAPSRVVQCAVCGDHEHGGDAPESTRDIRRRLVAARHDGFRRLRIASAGSLSHPAAISMLEEVVRLGFEEVEVVAEGSVVADLSDDDLAPFSALTRFAFALYGPDARRHDAHVGRDGAFAATISGAARLAKLTQVSGFAVLHDADLVSAFASAWEDGDLPGQPSYRLSPRGGSLDELGRVAPTLPESSLAALAVLLPPCILDLDRPLAPVESPGAAWRDGNDWGFPVSGSDRLGSFAPCPCERSSGRVCPGIAAGWRSEKSGRA